MGKPGYVPRDKLLQYLAGQDTTVGLEEEEREKENGDLDEGDTEEIFRNPQQNLICKRCFSLKHYNTTLNVTLQAEDYQRHLSHLSHKRALILLVVDVIDFPGSLFPDLSTLVSPVSRVLVVGNKIDLLPRDSDGDLRRRLEGVILDECRSSSLRDRTVLGVEFTSVKSGEGLERLGDTVMESWGNRGDVYLLGCTNVGKSSLFNYLLVSLCGASPGELVGGEGGGGGVGVPPPVATISHWPGTTLGLLSFPLMSVGKRRRLLSRGVREVGLETHSILVPTTTSVRMEGDDKRATTEVAQNRFWLHDTPGAINDAQVLIIAMQTIVSGASFSLFQDQEQFLSSVFAPVIYFSSAADKSADHQGIEAGSSQEASQTLHLYPPTWPVSHARWLGKTGLPRCKTITVLVVHLCIPELSVGIKLCLLYCVCCFVHPYSCNEG